MSIVRRLLLLLLALTPLVGFEGYTHVSLWGEREAEITQEALRLLDLIQTEQQRIIDDIHHILATLAETGGAEIAGPACATTMDRLRPQYPAYLTIAVADRTGVVRCATEPRAIGANIAARPHVQRALATGQFAVGEYDFARSVGHHVLPFAMPFRNPDGTPGGVIAALLDLDWLKQYQARKPLPPNSAVVLTDRSGTVILRVPEVPSLVGTLLPERFRAYLGGDHPGTALIDGVDHVARVFAYSPSRANDGGLALAVGIDRAAALRTVDRAAMRSWALFASVLALSLIGAAWGIGRFSRAVQTERTLLKAVLKHLPSGVVVAEAPSGRVLLHNAAAARLIGRSLDKVECVAEYPLADKRHPDGTPYRLDELPLVRALRHGEVVEQEEILRQAANGAVRTYVTDAAPVRDRDGRITLAITALTDITERKATEAALRRSEERFRTLVEHTPVMMWINRPDGTLEFFNAAWRAYTGLAPDESSLWVPILPNDQAHMKEVRARAIAAGEAYGFDTRMRRHDGAFRWHTCRVHPLHQNGTLIAWVGTAVDVHESRLAREVAEQANRSKSRFLAAASHDLRQPLQSMVFFAEALRSHVHSPRGRDALAMLERGMDTLKGLLDSLLDVSRLDSGVIEPSIANVAIKPLLDDIGAAYAPVAAAKGLEFRVKNTCDCVVRSDRNLLGRMVRNLVENAIRYTERGAILLECRAEDGHVGIAVRDTGIGIPPDQLTQIFEEFHQVGNPERDRSQGLGLGLSIVQKLSVLLEHPVEVRSELGKGSVFRISVPSGSAEPISVAPAQTKPDGHGRLAVLIDDDAIVLMGLRSIFQDWGFETIIAASTEQALDRLQASGRRPDIVVADYRLRAHRVGTEAIVRIREQVGTPVPAVLLTGDSGPEVRHDAERHGIGLIFKPVTARLLHEALCQ
ncbi:hybrid sensor histidine kinase/response regulator [Azospirillum canadense]|uniref:hybrid sensor histidine kinase/response regulator n=1 Tax=Azospirillum canadense TaxID=403962 RepID=UPI002226D2A1|nr:ATP-binding protein [Azospirillum canadense]MCW2239353.1 PAS domain S-box-containing protein [Azospirillum canadense]